MFDACFCTEFALCSYADTNLFHFGGKNIAVSANLTFLNGNAIFDNLSGTKTP